MAADQSIMGGNGFKFVACWHKRKAGILSQLFYNILVKAWVRACVCALLSVYLWECMCVRIIECNICENTCASVFMCGKGAMVSVCVWHGLFGINVCVCMCIGIGETWQNARLKTSGQWNGGAAKSLQNLEVLKLSKRQRNWDALWLTFYTCLACAEHFRRSFMSMTDSLI